MSTLRPDSVVSVHARVSIRPEPFGALLYHFSTRQLSFLKDRMLLDVVCALDGSRTVAAALTVSGVPAEETARYLRALDTLATSRFLVSTGTAEAASTRTPPAIPSPTEGIVA